MSLGSRHRLQLSHHTQNISGAVANPVATEQSWRTVATIAVSVVAATLLSSWERVLALLCGYRLTMVCFYSVPCNHISDGCDSHYSDDEARFDVSDAILLLPLPVPCVPDLSLSAPRYTNKKGVKKVKESAYLEAPQVLPRHGMATDRTVLCARRSRWPAAVAHLGPNLTVPRASAVMASRPSVGSTSSPGRGFQPQTRRGF